jgi:hypothetical protein
LREPSVRLSGVVLIEDRVEGVPELCSCSFLSGLVVSDGGDLVPTCQRANPRRFNLHTLISHALNTWISWMLIQNLLPKQMSMEMISPFRESNSTSPQCQDLKRTRNYSGQGIIADPEQDIILRDPCDSKAT